MILPLLTLIIIETVTYVLGAGVVTGIKLKAEPNMETQPRCHVRRTWKSIVPNYRMVCYQCKDDPRSIVLYYNDDPIDSADVTTCNHNSVASSVTVIPPATDGVKDTIEYSLKEKDCQRVNYYRQWKTNDLQNCEKDVSHFVANMIQGYMNGWKEEKEADLHGVVREILRAHVDIADGCTTMQEYKSTTKPFFMTCYDCKYDFKAVLYYEDTVMGAASVGTCRSPELEDSIDLVEPDVRTPTDFSVQFLMDTDTCVLMSYALRSNIFLEPNQPERHCKFHGTKQEKCQSKAILRTSRLTGHRNNWKKGKLGKSMRGKKSK